MIKTGKLNVSFLNDKNKVLGYEAKPTIPNPSTKGAQLMPNPQKHKMKPLRTSRSGCFGFGMFRYFQTCFPCGFLLSLILIPINILDVHCWLHL